MRRSAAPSQRKCSPEQPITIVKRTDSIGGSDGKVFPTPVLATTDGYSSSQKRLISSKTDEDSFKELDNFENELSRMFSSSSSTCATMPRQSHKIMSDENSTLSDGEFRFSAVWTKASSRKHKIWEGDCTVVVTDGGRKTVVKDTDGKILACSNNAFKKVSSVSAVECGYRFMAGGKEIEICKFLATNDSSNGEVGTAVIPKMDNRLFHGSSTKNFGANAKRRRFAVEADAFALPRPSSSQVLKFNNTDEIVTDVAVDGFLSRKLRTHQKDGVVFLYKCIAGFGDFDGFGAILADEMGLGKTLQCIACLWTVHKQGPFGGQPLVKRTLVVVPSSLVHNWVAEFKKWLGTERLRILAAQKSVDIKTLLLNPLYSVLVISYDLAIRCREDLERVSFDLLICDEGHRLKNGNIKIATFLSSLPIKRRILLTGTPVQNDLNELYTLSDFVNPDIFGSRTDFRRIYEDCIVKSQQKDADEREKALGISKAKELNTLISQFLLRRTAELNEKYLPAKIEYVLFCKPSNLQLEIYDKMLNSKFFNETLSTACLSFTAEHLTYIDALRKLCNHPSLLFNSQSAKIQTVEIEEILKLYPSGYKSNVNRLGDSGKLFVLFDLLASVHRDFPKERIVVVSNFTSTLDLIGALCSELGYKVLRLDGSTVNTARSKVVAQFNAGFEDTFLFLLSSKAGGVGLNLIGANRIILYDIDWNPANDLQAMARIWRDGQKRVCHIYRLLTTGTIEEKMFQRQIKKQSLSGAVVDVETSEKANQLSECVRFLPEELKDIFTLHTNTECQTHDLIKCSCDGIVPAIERLFEEDTVANEDQRKCQLGNVASSENAPKVQTTDHAWQDC